jgi:AcrR family transcriptional regulator
MGRWDPGSEERLRRAALELFAERGYEAVTAADIASRAGLTRRSFFRLFSDKREVLFGDSSRLLNAIEDGIARAGDANHLRDVVLDVLTEAGTSLLALDDQASRQKIIRSTPELMERERTKTAAIGAAVARGLTAQDVPASEAELVGAAVAGVFRIVYAHAALKPSATPFSSALRDAMTAVETFLAEPRTN